MKKWWIAVAAVATIGLLSACGKNQETSSSQSSKLKIVTTFYPMYDFTKNVVGNRGDLELLIPAGTEPHDYEPSAKDIAKIEDADVFVYNSKEMETWVPSVLKSIDQSKTQVIDASKGITLRTLSASEEEEHEEGKHEEGHHHAKDPHVWLNPVLAQKEVANIYQGLAKKDQKHQATYKKNYQAYEKKLKALDQEYATALKDAQNRTFVTQHTAFYYLAKQYGLTQKAISGLSPDQEPTPTELASIETFVKENKVKVIYTEEVASKKIAETVSEATGAKLVVLNPLEGLTNKEQKAGVDYIKVMQTNLKALQQVIQ